MQPASTSSTSNFIPPSTDSAFKLQSPVNTESTLQPVDSSLNQYSVHSSPVKPVNEKSTFDATIPVVDMNDFFVETNKQKFIDDFAKGLREVGFVAVMNSGVDLEALDAAYETAEKFFRLSDEEKKQISNSKNSGQRGYIAGEEAKNKGKKDYKEFLHIGRELTEEQKQRLGYFDNIWPTTMDLKGPMYTLFKALEKHMVPIQQAMALGIGQPENLFTDMTKEGDVLLRAIHYLPNPPEGHEWAGEHTDIDFFTILPRATEAGLEVKNKKGEWIPVVVPPNAFIINAGDMLRRMSNGEYHSSWHRVVSKGKNERFSMVYFVHPRNNDEIGPLPKSIERTGGVAKFASGTRTEFLFERLTDLGLISDEAIKNIVAKGVVDRMIDANEDVSAKVVMKLIDLGVSTDKQVAYLGRCGQVEKMISEGRAVSVKALQKLVAAGVASHIVTGEYNRLEAEMKN